MKTEKSKTQPQGYTVNQLAMMLGRDRRTITKAVDGLKPSGVDGNYKYYSLEAVEEKLKTKGDANLRDQKLAEEVRKLRIQNDAKEGKLVARESVAASIRRILGPADQTLEQKLVNEWPSMVAGQDVPAIRIYGKRLADDIRTKLRELETEWK
jgi:biotin operon repressor